MIVTFDDNILIQSQCASFFPEKGLHCYVCHPNPQSGKHCKLIDEAEQKQCNAGEQFCLTIDLDGEITRDCFLDTQGTRKDGCRERGTASQLFALLFLHLTVV